MYQDTYNTPPSWSTRFPARLRLRLRPRPLPSLTSRIAADEIEVDVRGEERGSEKEGAGTVVQSAQFSFSDAMTMSRCQR